MFIILIITTLIIIPRAVHAYIDPGTGTYLLQIIAALIVSSLFVLRTGWKQVVCAAKRIFKHKKSE